MNVTSLSSSGSTFQTPGISNSFLCPSSRPTNNYTDHDVDTMLLYKHYINGCFSLPVILVGIVANSVAISALLHRSLRNSSTNAYLTVLSLSNLMSLLCMLLMDGIRFTLVHPYRHVYCLHWYENWISLATPFLAPIKNLFQLNGIYLIMAVSIDRLILIKSRMKSTKTNKRLRKVITWIVIMCIFFFCIMFTFPNWFLFKSVPVAINITTTAKNYSTTLTYYKNTLTDFGKHKLVSQLIHIFMYIPFVFAIPILVLFIVNFLIIGELIKINRRKKQLGHAGQINRSITIMLVMIVLLFLVCQVPLAISHALFSYKPEMLQTKALYIYQSLTNFLTCINLSANFGLFCFFGQAFRDTIKFMFCLIDDLPDDKHLTKQRSSLSYDALRRRSTIFNMFSLNLDRRKSTRLSLPVINQAKLLEDNDLGAHASLLSTQIMVKKSKMKRIQSLK